MVVAVNGCGDSYLAAIHGKLGSKVDHGSLIQYPHVCDRSFFEALTWYFCATCGSFWKMWSKIGKFHGILLQGFSWTSCPTKITWLVSLAQGRDGITSVGWCYWLSSPLFVFIGWSVNYRTCLFFGGGRGRVGRTNMPRAALRDVWDLDFEVAIARWLRCILFLSVVFVQLLVRSSLFQTLPVGLNTFIKNINFTKTIAWKSFNF